MCSAAIEAGAAHSTGLHWGGGRSCRPSRTCPLYDFPTQGGPRRARGAFWSTGTLWPIIRRHPSVALVPALVLVACVAVGVTSVKVAANTAQENLRSQVQLLVSSFARGGLLSAGEGSKRSAAGLHARLCAPPHLSHEACVRGSCTPLGCTSAGPEPSYRQSVPHVSGAVPDVTNKQRAAVPGQSCPHRRRPRRQRLSGCRCCP